MFHIFVESFLISKIPWFIELLAFDLRWQILLIHIMIWIIMRIFISDPLPKLLMPTLMCILQMNRNRSPGLFDRVHGRKDRVYSGIALWCTCHIGDCL